MRPDSRTAGAPTSFPSINKPKLENGESNASQSDRGERQGARDQKSRGNRGHGGKGRGRGHDRGERRGKELGRGDWRYVQYKPWWGKGLIKKSKFSRQADA